MLPDPSGLAYDPDEAIAHLKQADDRMGALIDRAGPFTLQPRGIITPFESLLGAIISQQISGYAAQAIHRRVLALLPRDPGEHPQALLDLPEESLRAAGMSMNKVLAARDLAARTLEGIVPAMEILRTSSDDEIVEHLTQVRGIGRWTVEMLLLFDLGRPDVFPVMDLGVRVGFQRVYSLTDLPKPKWLMEYGERWRPFRSVASWYLWKAKDERL